jgi:NAD(P)-dependent dehydrogenase (short-subunit alcohol dehydrogenase family)
VARDQAALDAAAARLARPGLRVLAIAGINVTVVHPGMTATERTSALITALAAARGISEADAVGSISAGISIGRMVTAADVVAFLASPAQRRH